MSRSRWRARARFSRELRKAARVERRRGARVRRRGKGRGEAVGAAGIPGRECRAAARRGRGAAGSAGRGGVGFQSAVTQGAGREPGSCPPLPLPSAAFVRCRKSEQRPARSAPAPSAELGGSVPSGARLTSEMAPR